MRPDSHAQLANNHRMYESSFVSFLDIFFCFFGDDGVTFSEYYVSSSPFPLCMANKFSFFSTLLWARTLLRISGGRLPKRIVFGNLEGAVRRGRGGKDKEWTDCVQSDIRAFGIAGD